MLAALLLCSAAARADRLGGIEKAGQAVPYGGSREGPRSAPWLLRGPFDPGSRPWGQLGDGRLPASLVGPLDYDFLGLPEGEGNASPGAVQDLDEDAWIEFEADGAELDLGLAFPSSREGDVAYAFRAFAPESPGPARLSIASSCGVKVWIAGQLVYERRASRDARAEGLVVELGAGRSGLLVKVERGSSGFGFSLGLGEIDGPALGGAAAETGSRARELRLALLEGAPPSGGALRGIVLDGESTAGETLVLARDSSGAIVARASALVGRPFIMKLPGDFSGILGLEARGVAALEGMVSRLRRGLAGEAFALARESVSLARLAARGAAPFDAARGPLGEGEPRRAEDFASTLTYLADSLEARNGALGLEAGVEAMASIEAVARALAAGEPLSGLHRRAYRSPVDGALLPYSLYVPEGRDPGRRYGLVLSLPGQGESDLEAASRLASARPPDMLIASPSGRGEMAYSLLGAGDATDLLDLVMATQDADPDRVYLVGLPGSARGIWTFAQLHAQLFAAFAIEGGRVSLPYAENLEGRPLRALGPGGGDPFRTLAFFRGISREAWPRAIEVRAPRAAVGRREWIAVLGLRRPGLPAALSARVLDERHVVVETDLVSRFEMDLGHPLLAKGGRILVDVDGRVFAVDAGTRALRFDYSEAGGSFERVGAAAGARFHRGGGFAQLLEGPVCIVYGTVSKKDSPRMKAFADGLAAAGLGSGKGVDRARVLADGELESWMRESVSLILVGGPAQNALTSRIASSLPAAERRGRLFVEGEDFGDSSLALVLPDPASPGRLLGLAWPGESALDDEELVRAMLASIPSESDPAICLPAVGTPDLRVIAARGMVIRAASWDPDWSRLEDLQDR